MTDYLPKKGEIRWYSYVEKKTDGKLIALLLEDFSEAGTKCFILSDTGGFHKPGEITQIYGLDTAKLL